MKKLLISLCLSIVLVLSLVACGGSQTATESDTAAAVQEETKAAEAATEAATEATTEAVTEAPETEAVADEDSNDGFSLLDISADLIESGLYAIDNMK